VTSWPDRVRAAYDGAGVPASIDVAGEPLSVDVDVERWVGAVLIARDALGCTFFDWLSAVDETDTLDAFRLVCHLAAHRPGTIEHLVVRTLVRRDQPQVASVAAVYAGARWHERETHEMFGIDFTDDGAVLELDPLLLPSEFDGHPLRKDFVLVTRVATPWPGEKEPGESDSTPVKRRSRRRARPLGIPEPGTWGSDDDGE
jgi:NADH:ubiquinone oxidoreductase subunit C